MEEQEKLVELRDAFVYQGQTLVLNGVDLDIYKGEFVYLIGKTGSGKSSLLKTLYGDLVMKQGSGKVVDYDLNKLKPKEVPYLRRKLGIVFQDFQLLMDRTIEENLNFVLQATGWANKHERKTRIDEVLGKVGLQTKGFRMPHELSGGEQQRVGIARALLNHPPLILADEPTGNLDPDTSEDIMRLLVKINKDTGAAVLMATHNYHVIEKYPARLLRVAGGDVTEEQGILMP